MPEGTEAIGRGSIQENVSITKTILSVEVRIRLRLLGPNNHQHILSQLNAYLIFEGVNSYVK